MRRWVDDWIFGAESYGAEMTSALSCNGAKSTWRSDEVALSWGGAELNGAELSGAHLIGHRVRDDRGFLKEGLRP